LHACCTGIIRNLMWHYRTQILTALLLHSMAQHTNQGASKPMVHAESCPASAVNGNSALTSISTCPVDLPVAVDTNVCFTSLGTCQYACLHPGVCVCRLKPCSKGQMQRAQLLPRAILMLCRAPTLVLSMRPMSQRCRTSLMKPARGTVATYL